MPAPQKFLFDTSFDQPDFAATARRRAPEAKFTDADLEAARKAAFAEGRDAGLAEAAQQAESHVAAALEAIAGQLSSMLAMREAIGAEMQSSALSVIRTILHKAAPAFCRKEPAAEIEALLADCLAEALDEPRIVLRVADALFEPLQARLAAIGEAAGFAGKLVLIVDERIAIGDCRVEWADGGAERDSKRLIAEIDAALARLDTPRAGAPPATPGEGQ